MYHLQRNKFFKQIIWHDDDHDYPEICLYENVQSSLSSSSYCTAKTKVKQAVLASPFTIIIIKKDCYQPLSIFGVGNRIIIKMQRRWWLWDSVFFAKENIIVIVFRIAGLSAFTTFSVVNQLEKYLKYTIQSVYTSCEDFTHIHIRISIIIVYVSWLLFLSLLLHIILCFHLSAIILRVYGLFTQLHTLSTHNVITTAQPTLRIVKKPLASFSCLEFFSGWLQIFRFVWCGALCEHLWSLNDIYESKKTFICFLFRGETYREKKDQQKILLPTFKKIKRKLQRSSNNHFFLFFPVYIKHDDDACRIVRLCWFPSYNYNYRLYSLLLLLIFLFLRPCAVFQIHST